MCKAGISDQAAPWLRQYMKGWGCTTVGMLAQQPQATGLVTQYHIKQDVVDILVIPALQRGRQREKSKGKLSYKENWSLVFKRLASEWERE